MGNTGTETENHRIQYVISKGDRKKSAYEAQKERPSVPRGLRKGIGGLGGGGVFPGRQNACVCESMFVTMTVHPAMALYGSEGVPVYKGLLT